MSDVLVFKLKKEDGYFDATQLEDNELSKVPSNVVSLSLENAPITDKGISNLPFLSNVRCIDLDSTFITDKSLEIISQFKNLEELWIEDFNITDSGFKLLALLPNLKYISFLDTEISDDAYDYVKDKLPNLKSEG
ncbi:hypothetical protein [Pseudoalteromonas luteoviolacea]|uniref:Uncharacterized protein n=1 Tax=Pseudoalteromonas luteoviolacea S4054 TaxID=1129367 RepID=A0A0F6AIC8_9GAMM|nr:hypothetical protein [Pseudoalteromonas luteoviolacea]AOT08712.1 hypothetical protein S4054249_12995 [Pseudoalteromonas luteoviolacea]AOT13627.1 hypothetical protein S40542_12970 [Pseudoalteromonas luteoviolacea]AOT18540.1 hypothetical protein S4054_12970 [Pseudoalteromonas luteoviolacea]KKE85606.1 hypothetical protein N479_25665 [Pseudoalteromonas luteoviolacea S4054]KZN71984.1 hypothetical protein N481_16365 [Pseudoalteromonas luteoviolacea S4047-1]